MGALEFGLLGAAVLLSCGLLALSAIAFARSRDRRLLVPLAVAAALLARALLIAAEPAVRLGLRADLTLLVDVAALGGLLAFSLLRRPRPLPPPGGPESHGEV